MANRISKTFQRLVSKLSLLPSSGSSGSTATFGSLLNFGDTNSEDGRDYMKNDIVYAVVNRISERVSTVPLTAYGANQNELDAIPIINNLDSGFRDVSFREALKLISTSYLAYGEAFIIRLADGYVIPISRNVTVPILRDGRPDGQYHFTYKGSAAYSVSPEDVLHLKENNPYMDSQNRGVSRLAAASDVLAADNLANQAEKFMFANKGIAGFVSAEAGEKLSPSAMAEIQKKMDEDYLKPSQISKVIMAAGNVKYTPIGTKLRDLEIVDIKLGHLRSICALYNVAPQLFGDTAASTYSNIKEMSYAFINNAVLPIAKEIIPKVNSFISGLSNAGVTLTPDEDSIPELGYFREQKAGNLIELVRSGILSAEEAREMLYGEKK